MRWLWYSFLALLSLGMLGLIAAVGGAVAVISYYGQDLPDYTTLKDYRPPIVSRLYAGDGQLLAEYAQEKRIFVPVEVIPDLVKQAFISAEDQNFYHHDGVDYLAVVRAAVTNVRNIGTNRRLVGASTITQQVAKNFLLTNEVSYERKIKEAILAFRMERAMSKERLLELYLNEIYLGERSYGVAAAALNYFNKSLEDLEIHEAAYLGALPKAPNNYDPEDDYEAAVTRRDWVIGRMAEDGYITEAQAEIAKAKPLLVERRDISGSVYAPYFAEEVRREIVKKYGESSLYEGGLAVRTSLDPRLQKIAEKALRDGLVEYDRRHGYRGPLASWDTLDDWKSRLAQFNPPTGMAPEWKLAVVLEVKDSQARFGLIGGETGELQAQYLSWAHKPTVNRSGGNKVTSARQVLSVGDVIMVDRVAVNEGEVWGLRQIPEVEGAVVAMDPHTGRILAMQGGWAYGESVFNRVSQAKRQPGSAFKPFVYLTALEKGLTPATLVLDAPIVIDQGPGLEKWRPANYSNEYYGPTPIRVGIEKSRNLMTVRLADYVGMEAIAKTAKTFGVVDDMPPLLANALGSAETTLLNITAGYAQFVNGGKKIEPSLIDRIQGRRGETLFRHDDRACRGCGDMLRWEEQTVPDVPDDRPQVADPRHAYQIVSMLEGVVQRGTGVRLRSLGYPMAGKTGTTNNSNDAWFVGFTPDLAVGVYVGYDEPRTLGRKETGSSVTVPIFKDFMEEALKETFPVPLRIPPGIKQVQINAKTGARAKAGDEEVIWEAFTAGTEPTDKIYMLDANGISPVPGIGSYAQDDFSQPEEIKAEATRTGTGGLY